MAEMIHLIIIFAALCAIALGLSAWWAYRAVGPESADEEINATTKDEILLPIWRYQPNGTKKNFPVILCHGLAATKFNLDLSEDLSLARYLRNQGYDVFVPELRGSSTGMALNPKSTTPDYWTFNFDDHAHFDVPAIIEAVKIKTGSPKVHWIGHSMGGMVVLAGAANGVTDHLASLTCLGSPSRFTWAVGRTKWLAKLGSTLRWRRAPLPEFGRFTLFGAYLLRLLVWKGPFNGRNIRSKDLLQAFAVLPNYVSIGMLRQIHQWMQTGLFIDRQGKDYLEDYNKGNCPALFIAGTGDSVASPKAVRIGFEHWGHPDKKYCELGRGFGHIHDYGHIDLAIGSSAPKEIFPEILAWLEAHDAQN